MYVWTNYMRHRAQGRGFNLRIVERLLDSSEERYFDTATGRMVAVGKHENRLIAVPFEREGDTITPVTVHATTRQQINFRLKTGRYAPA